MGWIVDVEFKRSAVHGMGVFARRPISKGSKVWQFDRSMQVCDRDAMTRLDAETLSFALWGGYLHKPSGQFLWYEDGMQFMNHGERSEANVGLYDWPDLADDHVVAMRDIAAGEELREDYAQCLDGGLAPRHWLRPFYLAFCPQHYAFLLRLGKREGWNAPLARSPQEAGRKRRTVEISASISTGFDSTAPNPEVRHAA